MKVLVLVIAAMGIAYPIRTEADRIVLSSQANEVVCELQVPAAGFHQIHMIHQGPEPRLSVVFRALTPACWVGAVWLGDIVPPPLLKGESTHGDGINIIYTACDTQPGYLGYMNFYAPGPAPSCCIYPITRHLDASDVNAVGCDLIAYVAQTGPLIINPDALCGCSGPVPVRETTWGRVKALYQ